MKPNKKLMFIYLLSILQFQKVYSMTFSEKFLVTTLSSCTVGGTVSWMYAGANQFDSQPRQVLTFMGATTGCISGAIFSYLFFDDKTDTLNKEISSYKKTIQDLSIQLEETQGQKQNGTFQSKSLPRLFNPFEKLDLKEGKMKEKFDPSTLPNGLNIKDCNKLWQFTLMNDGNDVENSKLMTPKIIAVSENFALVGFSFLYSPNNCFSPSSVDGQYAETYFPGLNNFLRKRLINYNASK